MKPRIWPVEVDALIDYHHRREIDCMVCDDFGGQSFHGARRAEWEKCKVTDSSPAAGGEGNK
jgi:hypothetical protein